MDRCSITWRSGQTTTLQELSMIVLLLVTRRRRLESAARQRIEIRSGLTTRLTEGFMINSRTFLCPKAPMTLRWLLKAVLKAGIFRRRFRWMSSNTTWSSNKIMAPPRCLLSGTTFGWQIPRKTKPTSSTLRTWSSQTASTTTAWNP